MRRFVFIVFLFVIGVASAQPLSKAFDYLSQQKYAKAEKIFRKVLRSSYRTDLIMGYYGLAQIYADSLYDGFNLRLAYNYLSKSQRYYNGANAAVKSYLLRTYGFSQTNF
jgi:hypothetical protein